MDIKVPIAVFISSFFYFASVISSNADVYVSDSLGLTLPSLYYAAEAGEIKTIDLNGGEAGIEYEIRLNSSDSTFKDVRFAICNIDELPKYISNQTSNCKIRSFTGETNFNHSVETDKKDVLVIDNRASHFSTKRVYVEMYANVFLTEVQKSEVELGLQNTLNVVHEFFDVKEFDLNLIPCGSINAYSAKDDGDIYMCSELLFDTETKGIRNAFAGIFMHELGHTLLNLWNDPNFDNELTADNFAAAAMIISENFESQYDTEESEDVSSEDVIRDLIKFFESISNISQEAQAAFLGDQHPLSIQRINNFKSILTSPKKTAERWTNSIYPHLTVAALESIIETPHIGADIDLAKSILSRKKACGTVELSKCVITLRE